VDRLGKGLPNLYLGTELPRGSARAVARTGPGWVKMFRLSAAGSPPRHRFRQRLFAGSDAGGHNQDARSCWQPDHLACSRQHAFTLCPLRACSETSLRHVIQAFFERLVMSQHAMRRESLQDGVRLAFTN
jgi:hypothetical protein